MRSDLDTIRAAAVRAELDPEAALAGAQDQAVKDLLRSRTEAAIELGVIGVPSIAVGATVLWGDDRVREAVALVGA
ncbi:MAG: DsbA family protein [Solirubrobacterales bacterium]